MIRFPLPHILRAAITCVLLPTLATVTTCRAEEQSFEALWKQQGNPFALMQQYIPYAPLKVGRFSLGLEQTGDPYRRLGIEQPVIGTRSLTFSYEGSTGHLGLSAGYIYSKTSRTGGQNSFPVAAPLLNSGLDINRSLYMALDLSRSYRFGNDISLGLSGRSMFFGTPFEDEETKTFSLLFNLPISYKNALTITPELQWYRNIYEPAASSPTPSSESSRIKDSFYGGVSISFSY